MVLKKFLSDNSFPVLNVLALSLSDNRKGEGEYSIKYTQYYTIDL